MDRTRGLWPIVQGMGFGMTYVLVAVLVYWLLLVIARWLCIHVFFN